MTDTNIAKATGLTEVRFRDGQYRAQLDYRATGAFDNRFRRHTDAWRGYHSEESKRLLKEITGED